VAEVYNNHLRGSTGWMKSIRERRAWDRCSASLFFIVLQKSIVPRAHIGPDALPTRVIPARNHFLLAALPPQDNTREAVVSMQRTLSRKGLARVEPAPVAGQPIVPTGSCYST
jgi:hypothetical protein